MKELLGLATIAASLFFAIGCGGTPPATEADTQKTYEDPDYEAQMMGEMAETPAE